MMNKLILTTIAVLIYTAGFSQSFDSRQEPAIDPSTALTKIADRYVEEIIKARPYLVYSSLSEFYEPDHSAWPDRSPAARSAFKKVEDETLEALMQIDPATLTERGDWVTWHTLKEQVEADIGLRVCRQELWSLNHMHGWQNLLSLLTARQPVETEQNRADALSRWTKFPGFVAQDRANLEAGLAEGYSVPKRVASRVLAQFDRLIAIPFENHPYFSFVHGTDDEMFREEMKELYESDVLPALTSFRDFLRDEYIPAAREELSITAIPNGAECYEAMLRSYHTAQIGARNTYERGKAEVELNREEVIARGREIFGIGEFGDILKHLSDLPENRFTSETELIDYSRSLEPEAKMKVARFFSRLPDHKVIVEPYPDFLRGTGQSSRYESSMNLNEPAIYRISTDNWEIATRGGAERLLVHETWPGHHLQIAMAHGIDGLHPVTRLARSAAYTEGWARYAEALAEEAGIYKNGYGEISRRAWPARGMVVDPGLHLYGWTNEQAKAFMIEAAPQSDEAANDMLDRIAVTPGQLTAYDTGGLEIMDLRRMAEQRLGDRFDIREFHDRVLENGALPLGALREYVEAWVEELEKETEHTNLETKSNSEN